MTPDPISADPISALREAAHERVDGGGLSAS